MLGWFMNNLDIVIQWDGKEIPLYWLWHQEDHLIVLQLRDETGCPRGIVIREAFERKQATEAAADLGQDSDMTKGIRLSFPIGFLQHHWTDVDGGVEWRSFMLLGVNAPGAWPVEYPNESGNPFWRWIVNSWIVPSVLSTEAQMSWLKHNIEENSMLENFLPELYARRAELVVPDKSVFDVYPVAKELFDNGDLPRPDGLESLPKQHWEGGEPLDPMREIKPCGKGFSVYPDIEESDVEVLYDALAA